jgi:Fe-S cluster assembly protein SufD
MTAVTEEREAYRAGFERFASSRAAAAEPAWLRERRSSAFARFVETGFPTPRDEAWRHTPVAPLTRGRFETADPEARPAPELLGLLPREGFGGLRLVVVNGRLSPELSTLEAGARGVLALGLRDAMASRPDSLEPWLGRVAALETGAFSLLNTAFAGDGVVILVAPGSVVHEPILIEHIGAGNGAATVSYERTLVVAGRGSECRVVESFASPDGRAALTNAVTEVVVEDGARVDRCKLQQEGSRALHVATLAARLGRDARFGDHSMVLGAALSRDDIDVRFAGEGGEVVLNGLFVVDGSRVADTHSRIDHAVPHCTSRELYKGVLDGQARGVFNGLVVVRPGAQKTDAWQMNRNLLLSKEALVHSTPQLEILADDVKCKHGSTTGQLDPGALFYLRSRGIGEAAARSLLTWAFASDLLRHVPVDAVRRAVVHRLQAQLPGMAGFAEAVL